MQLLQPVAATAAILGALPAGAPATSATASAAAPLANCTWNATLDPRSLCTGGAAAQCTCSGNATLGSCGGTCGGCAFQFQYDGGRLLVTSSTRRCLELQGDGPYAADWLALSTLPAAQPRAGRVTLRRAAAGSCPTPFGSFNLAQSCLNCHVDPTDCALRCECKAGDPSKWQYEPMGCDLTSCNDLGLEHDSLTCRGQICPAVQAAHCPAPQGSYAGACQNCWVDDACLLRCWCKTPPDGHLTPTGCDLTWAAAGNCVGGISNNNGFLSCGSKACPAPPNLGPAPLPP